MMISYAASNAIMPMYDNLTWTTLFIYTYCRKKLLQNLMHQIAGLGIDNRTMCFHPQFSLNFPIKSMIVVFISTCKYQQ